MGSLANSHLWVSLDLRKSFVIFLFKKDFSNYIPEDDITNSIHDSNEDKIVPLHSRVSVQEISRDQSWEEGECQIGGDKRESKSSVESVMRVEVVGLKEQSIHGIENLESCSKNHSRVGLASSRDNGVSDHDNIEERQG